MWWTGQNAGAIQALSGVGVLLLTAALTYVTWKYVQLTSTIASLTRSQLEHDLLPKVAFPRFDIDASTPPLLLPCVRTVSRLDGAGSMG